MILMIDNYDSFTYNLVQYFYMLEQQVKVFRNDALSVEDALALKPQAIVISPGPGRPENAGISVPLILAAAGKIPLLGVCLGHQAIGQAFGGKIVQAKQIMHGKLSEVVHDGKTLFKEVPNPFKAVRYHSLAVERESLPECFEVSAKTTDGEIMGIRHREMLLEGIQYHPESIMTSTGRRQLANFMALAGGKRNV
ncbi:MAG: aminodeoxychorismate/anthranilate synthase component II [Victivallaceae bacterium]|nr:aminodeoxychorismate/anthranilate synthase component II [Victivallaceae bacterium]MDD3116255.1 aminodeoxychorismate/anthranilate synthase component II [Victivallaceae bacterium]MDD3702941.1 aminodeoxychorismate/anthranilate synthase component II [Victivallaceae bacterium]MDD4317743.1 aminodeoxychorismate/anthranilate synthase component II [Victivallaceae bacterium]MDD5663087.1 aminodeoxychorismate/anthranilate synthase component II [Victivallaceae bacterium]